MPQNKRGQHPDSIQIPEKVGLPSRPFLWTLDQISVLIAVQEQKLLANYMYLEGRSIGIATRHQIMARNIAPPDQKPEWRVAERELIRWLKFKGYKYYDRGSLTH